MFIKVLYVVLVLCTVALVGAVVAAYLKIRKHMRQPEPTSKQRGPNFHTGTPSGS